MAQRFLPRRLLVGGTSTALLLGAVGFLPLLGSASAAGEGGGLGLPKAGCNTFADPKGDANVGSQSPSPVTSPNDPDLDITGVVLGTNAKAVTAYIRIDKLADRSQYGDGHQFNAYFTAKGKDVNFTTFIMIDPAVNAALDPLGSSDYVNIGGSPDDTIPLTATYDKTDSMVILSADRAALEKSLGGSLAGLSLTKLSADSATDIADVGETADVAAAPAASAFVVGSNACFGTGTPAPAPSASPTPSPSPTSTTPPPASSGDPTKDLPKPGCVTQADAKGDSKFAGNGPNDPDIDLTGLIMRSTPTELVAYLGVDKLAAGPSTTDGHRFTLGFTFNKHTFAAAASSYAHGSGPIKDGLAQTGQFSHVTQLSVDGGGSVVPDPTNPTADKGFKTSGLKATFDTTHSRVVLELPISDITKYDGGVPFTGDLTAVLGTSATDNYASSSPADYVSKDNTSTSTVKWTIGDNACFAPPPGVLANVGATTTQYGDPAAVAAKLTDSKGAVLAGRTVTFTLAGATATAKTGADGVARTRIPTSMTAGTTTLSASFAGDASADKVSLTVPFTVVEEKTKVLLAVTKKGNARTVAITLLDDDKHAVAAQKVAVYVNGKLVSTLTTNAAGKVSFTKANPSQTVKVVFNRVAGKYLASSAQVKL